MLVIFDCAQFCAQCSPSSLLFPAPLLGVLLQLLSLGEDSVNRLRLGMNLSTPSSGIRWATLLIPGLRCKGRDVLLIAGSL